LSSLGGFQYCGKVFDGSGRSSRSLSHMPYMMMMMKFSRLTWYKRYFYTKAKMHAWPRGHRGRFGVSKRWLAFVSLGMCGGTWGWVEGFGRWSSVVLCVVVGIWGGVLNIIWKICWYATGTLSTRRPKPAESFRRISVKYAEL
jgi:hypothetical protein